MSLIPPQTPSSPVQPAGGSNSSIPVYGSSSTAPTTSGPTAQAPAPTNGAGTGGTFPGASAGSTTASQLAVIENDLKSVTPSQFFAAYKISSADQQLYLANGALNINAVYLAWYKSLNQSDRQSVQSQMANIGVIPQTDANGLDNPTALGAFTGLLGSTSAQGTNVLDYLNQNATGTNAIQNQISTGLTLAQKNAAAPEIVTQTNPTTLAADITNAFDQALGYAPDAKQIQSFIDQIQGQETTYGSAPRAEAQAQIANAHAEESALNQIGPNGLDTVIQAYQAAVNGTKLPGAGTVQGPVNGAVANAPSTVHDPLAAQAPGSALPPGVAERYSSTGQLIGANIMPTPDGTTQQNVAPGIVGQARNFIQSAIGDRTNADATVPVTQYGMAHNVMPGLAPGTANTTPTHGGLYALSPADWSQAQSLYSAAKKYSTPGSAPQSVQLGAISALLQHQYDSNGGSWSKAVATLATGSPLGKAEGTHLSAFGDSVANEVNSQIAALQNQVNNSTVTTKVSAPDANAEASAAAKQSDPVGYYAANAGSWGEVLNQMIAGAPLMYGQGTQDTFSGPVPTAIAGSPTAAPSAAPTSGGKP